MLTMSQIAGDAHHVADRGEGGDGAVPGARFPLQAIEYLLEVAMRRPEISCVETHPAPCQRYRQDTLPALRRWA